MKHLNRVVLCTALLAIAGSGAYGQLMIPSDGSDGVLDPSLDDSVCAGGLSGGVCLIDLELAADGTWSTPGAGDGVYDGEKWAAVFKYSSVNIDSGVTVRFLMHPKRAPVVWLVQGDVTIDGLVDLSGSDHTGSSTVPSESGPGGFRGGAGRATTEVPASGGFGPGAGGPAQYAGGGSYASQGEGQSLGMPYGNPSIVPLIGGSGGGASSTYDYVGGGAGGGAILVAAGETVTVDGEIRANGGNGGEGYYQQHRGGAGSGGSIRIIADSIDGTGVLNALNGTQYSAGGVGRIRLEANTVTLSNVNPPPSFDVPGDPLSDYDVWPPSGAPVLKATQFEVDGQIIPIPADPTASLNFSDADVAFETDAEVTLYIEAYNIPLDWVITVHVVPISGTPVDVTAGPLVGDEAFSTTTAAITMPLGFSSVQLRGDAP